MVAGDRGLESLEVASMNAKLVLVPLSMYSPNCESKQRRSTTAGSDDARLIAGELKDSRSAVAGSDVAREIVAGDENFVVGRVVFSQAALVAASLAGPAPASAL